VAMAVKLTRRQA